MWFKRKQQAQAQEQTKEEIKILPRIPIVFACSNQYVPYLYVALLSMIEHISNENIYEINILETNFSDFAKRQIRRLVKDVGNVELKIINITKTVEKYFSFFASYKERRKLPSLHSLVAFYSIFIPEIFPCHGKMLFLDADLVIESDVADLYNIDMDGASFAGVIDFHLMCAYKCNAYNKEYSLQKYFDEVLEVPCSSYINTGVFLVDVPKLLKTEFLQKGLDFIQNNDVLYPDQDVYNKVLKGSTKFLSPEWNWQEVYENKNIVKKINEGSDKKYLMDVGHAKIFHYASKGLLHDLLSESEVRFWEYARRSPYYEALFHMRVISVQPKK